MTAPAATAPPRIQVTRPGVYDLPPEVYHGDPAPVPSLSSTGARRLLPPSCPALFAYEREHGGPTSRELDLGKAAHRLVLGVGPELVRIDADEWRTNAVKAKVAETRERGAVPLKPAVWDTIHEMAAAIQTNGTAAALLSHGQPERSLFWIDQATGVWCRTMLDWLPVARPGQVMYLPEYKTTRSAAPEKLDRVVLEHGYHIQAGWCIEAIRVLGLDEGAEAIEWHWIWQEKTPPYLVTVSPIRDIALQIGRERVREAIDLYARCTQTGRWPGYGDDELVPAGLPGWVENEYLRTHEREVNW